LPAIVQDERILPDPQSGIGIVALKPGAVTVAFRAFTLPQNQASVSARMIETIKTELEKNNFRGPIPRSIVHSITEN
jgi:small conductance mechanosensitive channel